MARKDSIQLKRAHANWTRQQPPGSPTAYSNEDGEAYGLSTAAVYANLAKPSAEQSMKIAYVPVRAAGQPDLYAE